MFEVIYFSRGGNTRKLANAIADELNVKAHHIASIKSLSEGTELFLGSGLYFMRPAKLARQFVRNNDFRGKKVAIFGTSATGIGIETIGMEWLLKRKGAIVTGKYYCPGRFSLPLVGKFLFVRKGRPAEEDLEKARIFARSIRNKFEIDPEAKREDRILSRA